MWNEQGSFNAIHKDRHLKSIYAVYIHILSIFNFRFNVTKIARTIDKFSSTLKGF